MTINMRFLARRVFLVTLAAGGVVAPRYASAATITVAPVPDQRTNFPEGPQATVAFTIFNPNLDSMMLTSATAAITNIVAGDGFDVASGAAVAPNQCPSIAAFNPKTRVPGQCNVTVSFSTTDKFTSDPENPGDLVTWNLVLQVTARSINHPDNSPQTASANMTVGVFDTSLPEPSTWTLFASGGLLVAAGLRGKRRLPRP